jgi:hypothetical protein
MEDNPNLAEDREERARAGEGNPPVTREPVTPERIAERAYLISQSEQAASDEENWLRAERELLEEQEQQNR